MVLPRQDPHSFEQSWVTNYRLEGSTDILLSNRTARGCPTSKGNMRCTITPTLAAFYHIEMLSTNTSLLFANVGQHGMTRQTMYEVLCVVETAVRDHATEATRFALGKSTANFRS